MFVGVGGFGAVNLKNLLATGREDYKIVATVDPFAEAPLACPHFKEIADVYRAGILPELAVISTPIAFHTPQICECLSHGTNVMCEKPVTGDIADLPLLEEAEKRSGCFVAIGYQWSYSRAIQELKQDILKGLYGKPQMLKTMVLWPRDIAYFTRSSGWAGRISYGGRKILDSVINNATAHYLHNILYLLGESVERAVSASQIKATLLRVNDIETFDTVTAAFSLPEGAKGFFVASHASEHASEPVFLYRFEKGSVVFDENSPHIIGTCSDGTVKDYGDPFAEPANKICACLDMIKNGEKTPLCGISAASKQALFVAKLHESCAVKPISPALVCRTEEKLYVPTLGEALRSCYEKEELLSESRFFAE